MTQTAPPSCSSPHFHHHIHHQPTPTTSTGKDTRNMDPNPLLRPTAPMDDLTNPPPTIPTVPEELVRKRRLSPQVVAAVVEALGEGAEVFEYGSKEFRTHASVFNGLIQSVSAILVRPTKVEQISRLIIHANAYTPPLTLSVKAGGYNTTGWAVAGQIILDLSSLSYISTGLPHEVDPLYLTPQPAPVVGNGKGKGRMDGNGAGLEQSPTEEGKQGLGQGYPQKTDGSAPVFGYSAGVTAVIGAEGDDPRRGMKRNASGLLEGVEKKSSADGKKVGGGDGEAEGGGQEKKSMLDALGVGSGSSGYGGSGMMTAHTTASPGIYNHGSSSGNPTYFTTTGMSLGSQSSSSSSSLFTRPSLHAQYSDPSSHPPFRLATFGAGTTAKQLDAHTAPSCYHVPLAAFPVGSAVMLTGGFGFLGRRYGLSVDNLVEVEMVLADGRVVWLSESGGWERCPDGQGGLEEVREMEEKEAGDLWWAVRGAGTALGVATRYRAKAYYVPIVYSGNLIYPFNPLTTPSLMRHVRDCIKSSPRTLYCNMIMTAGPVSLSGVIIIQLCFVGPKAEGADFLQALGSWEGERCLFKDMEERRFVEQQDSVANVLKGGAGRKWFIKSDLLSSLGDDVLWKTCQQFHTVPDGCTWLFEFTGGAVTDTTNSCIPASHREAMYTVAALHQWPVDVPQEDARCVKTAADWIDTVIHPSSPGGPYPCFANSSDEESVQGVYGENFDRLAGIKRSIDPTNFFRHTLWPSGEVSAIRTGECSAREGLVTEEGPAIALGTNGFAVGEQTGVREGDEVGVVSA